MDSVTTEHTRVHVKDAGVRYSNGACIFPLIFLLTLPEQSNCGICRTNLFQRLSGAAAALIQQRCHLP